MFETSLGPPSRNQDTHNKLLLPEAAGDNREAALPGTKGRAAEDMLAGVLWALDSCPVEALVGMKGLAWMLGCTA